MFEFLFKYSPVLFTEGELSINGQPAAFLLIAASILLACCLFFFYRKTTLEISNKFKAGMIAVKLMVLSLLVLLLLEPYLTVSTVLPRKSSLIVLVDDSKSMSIPDADQNLKRSDYVGKLLGSQDKPALLHELEQNFKLQMYKFSSGIDHLTQTSDLTASGTTTDLASSLNFAAEMGLQSSAAGVVVFTDGVNNSNKDPLEVAALLKNKNLPAYIVGVGSEDSKDIELAKVNTNRSVIENSVVEISALVKNKGIDEKNVDFELRENDAILKKMTVELKGSATRTALTFSPQKKGFAHYSLTVLPQKGELVKDNNRKDFIIDNRDKKARVLYVEGYPRAEFKFIRRALDGDDSIQLVSLLRTGPEKFYRQGINDQSELRDGFPVSRKGLFDYDALILGSVERSFFTDSQIDNIVEFVSQRGGGLMMLGGSHAFGDGGYTESALEKVLPVELSSHNKNGAYFSNTFRDKFKLLITPEGYRNPILQLATESSRNREIWDELPDLEGYNIVGRAKPGATLLAVHPLSEPDNPRIIMAQQLYGRGRSLVFATASSWVWQMGMPHADLSHERLWRQTMRWLALAAPSTIVAGTNRDSYVVGEEATLQADVRDSLYSNLNNAQVTARIKTPSGSYIEVPFSWSPDGPMNYAAPFTPQEEGVYVLEVEAFSKNREFLGKNEAAFLVEESKTEFNNAHLQASFLKRLAEVSGGKYYYQDEAEVLADEMSVMKSSYSKLVDNDLWDMPFWFLLVIILVSVEWYVRRSRGLS